MPITDIKAVTGSCTSGYEEMMVRRWPGTRAGCYCNGEVTVKHGSCGKGCEDIEGQAPVEITRFFNKTICVKRSGVDIMSSVRPKENNRTECEESNYKPCGSGDVSHEVCVLSSNDCPIDGIAITDQALPNYERSAQLEGDFKM